MSSPLTDIERSDLGKRIASLQEHHLGKRLDLALWATAPGGHPDDLIVDAAQAFRNCPDARGE